MNCNGQWNYFGVGFTCPSGFASGMNWVVVTWFAANRCRCLTTTSKRVLIVARIGMPATCHESYVILSSVAGFAYRTGRRLIEELQLGFRFFDDFVVFFSCYFQWTVQLNVRFSMRFFDCCLAKKPARLCICCGVDSVIGVNRKIILEQRHCLKF